MKDKVKHCKKCGVVLLSDEDSICGACSGEMFEGNTNGEEDIDWDVERDLEDGY